VRPAARLDRKNERRVGRVWSSLIATLSRESAIVERDPRPNVE
jgi:hypothetical protein